MTAPQPAQFSNEGGNVGTTNIKVNLVGGSATTDQNGAVTVDDDNDLKIKVGSGFADNAKVSSFTLYEWDEDKSNGQGKEVGSWSRSDSGKQPSDKVKIEKARKNIKITDVNTVADTKYCYTATVTDDNGDHTTPDPELIVKKKR